MYCHAVNPSVPWWPLQPLGQVHNPTFFDYKTFYPFHAVHIPAEKMEDIPLAEDCNNVTENEDDILMKYRLFKQFDTVEDYSDHHYASKGSSTKQVTDFWMHIVFKYSGYSLSVISLGLIYMILLSPFST